MGRQKEIFKEYARMRDNGLDAKGALNVLRPHIEGLNKQEREELAGALRGHEQKLAQAAGLMGGVVKPIGQAPPAPSSNPSIRPIQPAQPAAPPQPVTPPFSAEIEVPPAPPNAPRIVPLASPRPSPTVETQTITQFVPASGDRLLAQRPSDSDPASIVWVKCPNCGKTNQKHEVFCYSCGQMLEPVKGVFETRTFSDKEAMPLDSEFFGSDSVLVLRVRGTTETFEVRPQRSEQELVIGRSTQGSAVTPDVDLKNTKAVDLGVSRMHMTLRYESANNAVLAADLGSSNGSYLNGQRMLAKEVRVLRHGDELRLGKLVLAVSFRHPGNVPAE